MGKKQYKNSWPSQSKEYQAWADMKNRCLCESNKRFKDYGGRGIVVCRWALPKEQSNNTRRNVFIEYEGKNWTPAQLARRFGINRNTFYHRMRAGWSIDRIVQAKSFRGNNQWKSS